MGAKMPGSRKCRGQVLQSTQTESAKTPERIALDQLEAEFAARGLLPRHTSEPPQRWLTRIRREGATMLNEADLVRPKHRDSRLSAVLRGVALAGRDCCGQPEKCSFFRLTAESKRMRRITLKLAERIMSDRTQPCACTRITNVCNLAACSTDDISRI